jgi:hypothetical protein
MYITACGGLTVPQRGGGGGDATTYGQHMAIPLSGFDLSGMRVKECCL